MRHFNAQKMARHAFLPLVCHWVFGQPNAFADSPPPLHTNQPAYENPFDLAAGSASITRATQDGVVFANPSLPAFGAGFLRSLYMRTGLHANRDAYDLAQRVRKGAAKVDSAFLAEAIKSPYHAGLDLSAGFLTSKIAMGVFASTRIDIQGRQFGTTGMPELRSRSHAHGGAAVSGSYAWLDTFAFGLAVKPMQVAEANENIGLDALLSAEGSGETPPSDGLQTRLGGVLKRGYGISTDAGLTFQKRSKHLDVRVGLVGRDLGNTRFTGNLDDWRQTLSAGVGVTLHTDASALHCAADLRDFLVAYGEHWTRRTFAGCRAIAARWIGVAAGIHHGYPSFGGIVNLYVMRLEAGTYSREMGTQVGSNPRRIFFVALGSEIP